MTATFSVGAASATGGLAYGQYVIRSALLYENATAAEYYAGDAAPRDVQETALELKPDLSAEFAKDFGIDTNRYLTLRELGHLLNNKTAPGEEIEGRKKHSPHQSVASVFGLERDVLPSVEAIQNVLSGKRVDGAEPRSEQGNQAPLPEVRVESAVRKFRSAMGLPTERDITQPEMEKVAEGKIDQVDYFRQINATAQPIGYVDITFSTDKSVGIAYAQEKDPARRDMILAAVHDATADAMAYAETVLGVARSGAGGQGETEPAELIWVGVQHTTARPATDVVRKDAEGRDYTDTREIPTESADVHLHQHRIILSSMRTADGKIRAIDLDRLDGEIKVIGAVFHGALATRLRRLGADVTLGPHGEARVGQYPEWVRKFHSRRTTQGETTAREWAASQGKDWDKLDGEERISLIKAGAHKSRESKQKRHGDEGLSDVETWQRDAERAGYKHKSALDPENPVPELPRDERIEAARTASLPLIAEAFKTRAVVPEGTIKEIAARGLIASGYGYGRDHARDINAVLQTYRDRGVRVAGINTQLDFGIAYGKDGRPTDVVTTKHTISEEKELIGLVERLSKDMSGALKAEEIDAAAVRFLARHPRISPDSEHWKDQLKMAHDLGTGPRFSLAVGVAGSGKTSSVVAILTDACHVRGNVVDAMTVPWKATAPLLAAGVDHAIAVEAYIRRVNKGQHTMDSNTVLAADEVSMIPIRQQIGLLTLVEERGARIVEIGDPRQCQSVETPAIDLICKAIGDENIPKLLNSIRQKTARGRAVAAMFRAGDTVDALAAMKEDGNLHLVAGSPDAVIEKTVEEWRRKVTANAKDPEYNIIVITPTNARALDIGIAIRRNRREAGEIGEAETIFKAMDPNSKAEFDLPLSVGDKIRTFTRTHDADSYVRGGKKKYLSSNGDVVEIREILPDGFRIRNHDGDEGRVTWDQMKPWRAPKNDPIRISLGYAMTIDSSQSLTRSDAIVSMPDGSRHVTGYKAYTALSRHIGSAELYVSDAAERSHLISKQMLGAKRTPRESEVIANIAANLARFPTKANATDMRKRSAPDYASEESRQHREAARQQPGAAERSTETVPRRRIAAPLKRLAGPRPDDQVRREKRSMRSAAERPKTPRPTRSREHADVHAEFADALRREGFQLRGAPVMDGKWHREKVEGDKGLTKSGRYKAYTDGLPAGFIQNFKHGEGIKWRSDRPMPEMSAQDHRRQEADRVARESERVAAEEKAALRAVAMWRQGREVHSHAYLTRKGVEAHGLRENAGGVLMVPLVDADGVMRNVQTINPEGEKRFLTGGRKQELFTQLGTIDPVQPVLIAEGFATAATMREATGLPVIVAFDTGNLMPVAKAIHAKYPDAPIVFAADNDHHLPRREIPQPNVGREKAEAAAKEVGGVVLLPSFGDIETSPLKAGVTPPTDWNDFAAINGRDNLRQEIAAQLRGHGVEHKTDAPRVTQAQRDAARLVASSTPQQQAQDAVRQQLQQQESLSNSRGISR